MISNHLRKANKINVLKQIDKNKKYTKQSFTFGFNKKVQKEKLMWPPMWKITLKMH